MDNNLRLFVQRITKLPTIPVIAQEILNLVDDELSTVGRLEEIIANDPPISAKVLSFANSAFFGYKNKIGIRDAIMRIGYNNVKNIAVGISMLSLFENGKNPNPGYQKIFEHSVSVGKISRLLIKNFGISVQNEIFLGGLMHDLGFFVLNKYFSDDYENIVRELTKETPALEAEKAVLNFTHADIGVWLADNWNLPNGIHEIIHLHHAPSLAKESAKQVALIHLADYAANENLSGIIKTKLNYPLDNAALEILNISPIDFNDFMLEASLIDEPSGV
ncbi:MAG: HDOD domain-containing protein [Nitrospirae bacterium]|nr:HDOD domain-containing protein [Nitrospirota bacterium]